MKFNLKNIFLALSTIGTFSPIFATQEASEIPPYLVECKLTSAEPAEKEGFISFKVADFKLVYNGKIRTSSRGGINSITVTPELIVSLIGNAPEKNKTLSFSLSCEQANKIFYRAENGQEGFLADYGATNVRKLLNLARRHPKYAALTAAGSAIGVIGLGALAVVLGYGYKTKFQAFETERAQGPDCLRGRTRAAWAQFSAPARDGAEWATTWYRSRGAASASAERASA